MKKLTLSMLISTGLVGISLLGPSLIGLESNAYAQSSTSGAVRGVVRDKGDGNKIVSGAAIAATSPSLQGSQLAITGDDGSFYIDALPPGMYTLTVYWNNAEYSRGNVLIQLGKQAVVNVPIDTGTGAPAGEIIVIEGTAPILDQGSTKTGITIDSTYTQNIPVARTFGGVLTKAAGSQNDQYGASFSGSTSVENTYIVEGINTTDTAYGEQSSNLPTEFVEETEVITGGYNAEYGRSTGGVVNVVTKGGSNEFHGSVFAYYTPGALIAKAKQVDAAGSSISSTLDQTYAADLGAEIGGPIIKDKLWFHVGYNPSASGSSRTRTISKLVDVNGDGVADDANNDGFDDREFVSDREQREFSRTQFFTGKISGQVNPDNQFQVSVFGNPSTALAPTFVTRDPNTTRINNSQGAFDVAAKWTSKKAWSGGSQSQVDAVVGYHVAYEKQTARNAAQDVAGTRFERAQSILDFSRFEGGNANLAECAIQNEGMANEFDPCPVVGYTAEGLGFLEDRTNSRKSLTLTASHRTNSPIGYHTFKVGVDAELAGYDTNRGYPGGSFYQNYGSLWLESQILEVVPNGNPLDLKDGELLCGTRVCKQAINGVDGSTTNRNLGAYIQDSWQILPNLTVNAGVRWEQQIGYVADSLKGSDDAYGLPIADEGYKLNNMIAPRIGVIFDPTQEGKSKLFGHFGRFYENVPMDLNIRSFGGEITQQYLLFCPTDTSMNIGQQLAGCDPDGSIGDRVDYQLLGDTISFVSPGLKAQYIQEFVAGAEYELFADFKMGITYTHRSLPRVIEDVSTDGGNHYAITNPGENFDSEAAKLEAQSVQYAADGNMELATLFHDNAELLKGVKNLDKPSRSYDGVAITATQRPTPKSLLVATYTYSRSKGNFPGLFSTETGQLDPNINSIYDLPDLMANRFGALGLDRPHLLKVDGFYQFNLKKAGSVVLGGSFRSQSGVAQNTLARHPVYGNDESYVLARGSTDRSPTTWQVDVKASYGRKLSDTVTIEGFIDIFNLFNNQAEAGADERYTTSIVQPIVGGDKNDLLHAKTQDDDGYAVNETPILFKNYGKAAGYQSPLSMRFGVRLTF